MCRNRRTGNAAYGYLIASMAIGAIFEFLRTITDRSIQAKEADPSA